MKYYYNILQLRTPSDPSSPGSKQKPINQPNPKPKSPGYDDNVEPNKDGGYRRPPMQV